MAGTTIGLCGQGYREYYTGVASGFDMTATEAVLQVREGYEGIKLIAAISFRRQPLWSEVEDRLLYVRLQERMGRVAMVPENYHRGCYLRRDEYVVHKADTIIVHWGLASKGGTFYTMSKASESDKPVTNLYERVGQRLSMLEQKSEVRKSIGLRTLLLVYYTIYSLKPEEGVRCFPRSSFLAFCYFFLTFTSTVICFKGSIVSDSSRLNRPK